MPKNGFPVPIEHLASLAFVVTRQRSSAFQVPTSDVIIKPPGKSWPQDFYKLHPELQPKRIKALDGQRHDDNIADKNDTLVHGNR